MKLGRAGDFGSERPVVEVDGKIYDLSTVVPRIGPEAWGEEGRERIRSAVQSGLPEVPAGTRLGAPFTPGKVVCIGLNYQEHARETGAAAPAEPILFLKAADTVVGPYDEVRIPPESRATDYEVELGVVIGREASYLADADAARDVIAGYTVSHDVSERHWQLERGGQWDKGKNFPTFNPLGPWLVTADEVSDSQSLDLWLEVDGEQRQRGNTSDMIFTIEHIVWYVSQCMRLMPGDVINTGTPHGVAIGYPEPRPYLAAGSEVRLGISGLGEQRQRLVDTQV